jgi:hypothetical protein
VYVFSHAFTAVGRAVSNRCGVTWDACTVASAVVPEGVSVDGCRGDDGECVSLVHRSSRPTSLNHNVTSIM